MAISPGDDEEVDDEEVVVTRRQLRAFETAVKNREKTLSDLKQAQALWEKSKVDADELMNARNSLYDRAPIRK